MGFCAKSGFKSSHGSVVLRVALAQLVLAQCHVYANSSALTRMRSSKIASIHGLQAAAESLAPHAARTKEALNITTSPAVAGRYEIHTVSGEPNYKSVNLTWEVEFVAADGSVAGSVARTADSTVTNRSAEVQPPKVFQIFYCELQSSRPHRCRARLFDQSLHQVEDEEPEQQKSRLYNKQLRRYGAQVDNLRMATRYSFHIRPQQLHRNTKITGRSEIFNNEIADDGWKSNANYGGQTIVIPTKGFSAQATKCLPHASEIEVETGPYFGGKIVVDGGTCGIKGNPNDALDKYTMRIDHKLCGSLVKPDTNTVETFITVQENLGIFTHSTRRFVVVCSFQSGMQTVRASFTVPGKEGVASAVDNDAFNADDRMGREHRQLRYVDKSGLVLKESNEAAPDSAALEEDQAVVREVRDSLGTKESRVDERDRVDAVAVVEDIIPGLNEDHIKHEQVDWPRERGGVAKTRDGGENEVVLEEDFAENKDDEDGADEVTRDEQEIRTIPARLAKYAKLVVEQREPQPTADEWTDAVYNDKKTARKSALYQVGSNVGSAVITITLSVVMIGVFVYVVLRETRRETLLNGGKMHPVSCTRPASRNKQEFLQKPLQQQPTLAQPPRSQL